MLRIWEHEDPHQAALRVFDLLQSRRSRGQR